jgi:ABC-type xylose transport system permease subunit
MLFTAMTHFDDGIDNDNNTLLLLLLLLLLLFGRCVSTQISKNYLSYIIIIIIIIICNLFTYGSNKEFLAPVRFEPITIRMSPANRA